MLAILVIAPLIVAALLALVLPEKEESWAKYISIVASLLSLLIAITLLGQPGIQNTQWFSFQNISFSISTSTMPLNMLLLMIVSVITPLILLYSMGFMEIPSEQKRFYFEMLIFAASMMLFAISANFITIFIAWEMLGITSYLLIGFWYKKNKAPTAARKAITTILIGDIAFLIAIVTIFVTYNSFDFATILQVGAPYPPAFVISLILILIAAFTKSAQFPFHEWLPDAMEGPTPVSAFLHSSTMVKAGVFLIAVLLPLYQAAGLSSLILVVGLITAIIGASNALAERHIKRILAYSTIEDLGLMFVALGLGALYAAMLLFVVQAFYKALLFMSAGSIMKANDEEEDIYKIFGSGSNKNILITTAIGALSIAGIFPLSGFFGKTTIDVAASTNIAVYIVLLIVSLASSIYIFRWFFVPMRTTAEMKKKPKANYSSIPMSMIIPAYILAAFVIVSAYAYVYLPQFLGSLAATYPQIPISEYVIGTIVALLGIGVAYYIYKAGNRFYIAANHKLVYSLLYNNVFTNAAYLSLTQLVSLIANGFGTFDFIFDKTTYLVSQIVLDFGNIFRRMVNGQTNLYVFAFIVGMIVLVLMFIL